MRSFLAIVLITVLTGSAVGQTVDLPEVVTVRTGRQKTITVKWEGDSVDYRATPGWNVVREYNPSTQDVILQVTRPAPDADYPDEVVPESCVIAVGVCKAGKIKLAQCLLVVAVPPRPRPDPKPDPKPIPTPEPVTKAAYLIVIEESGAATVSRAKYFTDPDLRQWVRKNNIVVRVFDKDVKNAQGITPANLANYLTAAGSNLPHAFLVDDTGEKILSGVLPAEPRDFLSQLHKAGY